MALSDHVTLTITKQTTSPKEADFNTPLLMVNTSAFAETYRLYSSLTEVIADFPSGTVGHAMASSVFSQKNHPAQIAIGRLPTPAAPQIIRITGDGTSVTLGAEVTAPDGTVTTISETAASHAFALTAFVATATAITGVTVTEDTGAALFTADNNGEIWRIDDLVGFSNYVDQTVDLAYDDAIAALLAAQVDFYRIAIDCGSAANNEEVAAWALANKKMFYAHYQALAAADVSASMTVLRDGSYDRAVPLVTKAGGGNADTWIAAGAASYMSTKIPGSTTLKFKTIVGVQPDVWSSTDKTTLEALNAILYASEAGVSITLEGTTSEGEYVDIIEGTDRLENKMQTAVFTTLINQDKVPYTDAGGSLLLADVDGVLADHAEAPVNLLDPNSLSSSATLVANMSTADKSARRFNKISFKARYQGAIHKVDITGEIVL